MTERPVKRVTMTELHHNLAAIIEEAKQGTIIEVYNVLRQRVEVYISYTLPEVKHDLR